MKNWPTILKVGLCFALVTLIPSAVMARYMVAKEEIPVRHFGKDTKFLTFVELHKDGDYTYILKLEMFPRPLMLDILEDGVNTPHTVHTTFDLHRAGEITLATEDDIAYFSPMKKELRTKTTDIFGNPTDYSGESGDGIFGDKRTVVDYKLATAFGEGLIGAVPKLGDVYAAYKVANELWDVVLGPEKEKLYWGVVTSDSWSMETLWDLEQSSDDYKNLEPNASANSVFSNFRQFDTVTARWKELFAGYAYEINYIFTMARTKSSPHNLYVRALIPYTVVVIRTEDQKSKKKKSYDRFMEVEWKIPLKDGNEPTLLQKQQKPSSMASAASLTEPQVLTRTFKDPGKKFNDHVIVKPIEQEVVMTLSRPSYRNWYNLHIKLNTPNPVNNPEVKINPGIWIDPTRPGSIQLAVKDDTHYFGKAELAYRRAIQNHTKYGMVYSKESRYGYIPYPKKVDTQVTQVSEFLDALTAYGLGIALPDFLSAPLGFVPFFSELEKQKGKQYDWALTTRTPFGNDFEPKGSFDESGAAMGANPVFSEYGDINWDHQTAVWDKIGGGLVNELRYQFQVSKEPDATSDTDLVIRAVIPYERISTRITASRGERPHISEECNQHIEIEWTTKLSVAGHEAEKDAETDITPVAANHIRWAGDVSGQNTNGQPAKLKGRPDGVVAGLRAADSVIKAGAFGGDTTEFKPNELAKLLGIEVATLKRANFIAFEHNGTPKTQFESSEWRFRNFLTAKEIKVVTDFNNPKVSEHLIAFGFINPQDFRDYFAADEARRSGAMPFLLFSIPGDVLSDSMQVEIYPGKPAEVGTPDPDALGIIRHAQEP